MTDELISFESWLALWKGYCDRPWQQDAIAKLYVEIWGENPLLLSKNSEWYRRFHEGDGFSVPSQTPAKSDG